ncbi:hypothetical protein Dimus_004963 [Dionaea muscipula]
MIMSNQCIVPNEADEEGNRSSHVKHQQLSLTPFVPMSTYNEVAELTWQNGQLAVHDHLGGIFPTSTASIKPTWGGRTAETLECIVHQAATYHKQNQLYCGQNNMEKLGSVVESTGEKWAGEDSGWVQLPTGLAKKRARSNSTEEWSTHDRSACASAANVVRLGKDQAADDATLVTWTSFDSPTSLKTKNTDEDSAYGGSVSIKLGSESPEEEPETKSEPAGCRSHPGRRGRAAATHNQSERRRRDRINQKMKALQKLVPNANKTDKASMLDEVIEYLKQLQAQVVQMMMMCSTTTSAAGNMQIMMPLAGMQQQQHLQMLLLARMGMGMGMGVGLGMGTVGMLDHVSNLPARSAPQQLTHLLHPSLAAPAPTSTFMAPPPFLVPHPTIHQPSSDPGNCTTTSVPLPHPYTSTFLAQSMNIDLYNKIAAHYGQQVNQMTQAAASGVPQSSHVQGV